MTNNSISEMSRLMDIMNGKVSTQSTDSYSNTSAKTDSMKKILESFYNVSGNAIKSGKEFTETKEAYLTEETSTGVKIGPWYIDCFKQSNLRTYNIREDGSESYLVQDLVLYEAAYALVKAMLKNESMNSNLVNSILKLESDYSKSLNDAIYHKHALNSSNLSETRRAILEDRYEAAKYNAALAKHRIKELE
jgi:hypothetical protein